MTLLEFARGPALQVSLMILLLGIAWRMLGALFLQFRADFSRPRKHNAMQDGMRTMAVRSVPPHVFEKKIWLVHILGYVWHICLFVSVLLFTPHILLFESILGFGWPGIPGSFILIAASVALAILLGLMLRRLVHPVHRLISNADDYISILLTMLALLTGILAYSHLGLAYETMLALHLLSGEALFIWFPFGKLIHTLMIWPARFEAGKEFGRRGVKA